jgi:TatD DNase family protein
VDARVRKLIIQNVDSTTIEGVLQLERENPGLCYATMGLHPCYVKENWKEEWAIVEKWWSERDFVAVGEAGLDYYWDKTFISEQKIVFELQLQLAKKKGVPIIIHSRDSFYDCLEMVKTAQDGSLKGIFHCFSGSLHEAMQLIDLGFHLGIGGVLTFKNAELKSIVKEIDVKHFVLETDAPYLAPVPHRGKRNEPSYIPLIASVLAEIKQVSIDEIAHQTSINANQIFKNHI